MTMTISLPETIDVSSYAPRKPHVRHEPLKVAEDTYIIRTTFGEGEAPAFVYVNSAVILGQEPTIVDTGTVNNREDWLNDVFSLVDPKDVRYVVISHDDHDHVGNLPEVMALCPNATLITNWFQVERLAGDLSLPLNRMRWMEPGESFDAGDRTFALLRPPIFDGPTTRGLYDSKTGFYWAGDAFATLMTTALDDVSGMAAEEWSQSFATVNLAISPWVEMVDPMKFNRNIERLQKLDISVIVGGHTPAIYRDYIERAYELMYDLPNQPPAQLPTQADLDAILAAIGAGH